MRRLSTDSGAVAVVVALLAVVLLGFGALAIDVGALYAERRELQSGADAGALAVADECMTNACGQSDADELAKRFASDNASDEAADATACGTLSAAWTGSCAEPAGLPTGAKYVRVTATTRNDDADATTLLPPVLARAISPSYEGTRVSASAVVVVGGPARSGTTIPLIISACEWKSYTSDGSSYAPLPHDYETDAPYYDAQAGPLPYPVTHEAEIVTHQGTSETCKAGGGFNDVIPGGFGWLQTTKQTCDAEIVVDETDGTSDVDSKQGFTPCVKDLMASVLGTIVQVPIFANDPELKTYEISGWANLFVTGYSLTGAKTQEHIPSWDTDPVCFSSPSYDCITGYFLDLPASTGKVGGASFGETVVQLYE